MENAKYPQRKSPRADFHDYSGGDYFVTICTRDKRHFFGEIYGEEMKLTPIGVYCRQQIETLSNHYPHVEIPMYVVMSNHVHMVVCVDGRRTHEPCVPTKRSALSVVIGGLKRSVTLYARKHNMEFGWQGRYHDHIIRNTRDGNNIAEYIDNNVVKWNSDCFYTS